MAIIGITGFAGSGKGTSSQYVIQQHDFIEISFAKAVKDALSVMFGWDRNLLEGDTPESRKWRETKDEFWSKKFNKDITPRWAMQNFGTDLIRKHFKSDFWVNVVEKFINENKNKNIIVSDCRFKNEIDLIISLGGQIVEIQPKELPKWYQVAVDDNLLGINPRNNLYGVHLSEWDWVGYSQESIVIVNDGTIPELYSKMDSVIDSLKY